MNLTQVHRKFGTEAKCVAYLEKLRWNNKPECVFCGSKMVYKRNQKQTIPEYHCNNCNQDFTIIYGTIFENTQLELPKWFLTIAMYLNAKMGLSAKEIERNVGVSYKTAWYALMRMRCAMIDHCNIELSNVLEMDEAYVGGKPRHRTQGQTEQSVPSVSRVEAEKSKRGRGTLKTPVVGIVERRGKIVLKVIQKLSYKNLSAFLKDNVDLDDSTLITDEFRGYWNMDEIIEHYTVNHGKKQYVSGKNHTNTIEGYWSLLKDSIKGHQRAISKKYLPIYLVSSAYIFNHRNDWTDLFPKFMKQAVQTDKSQFVNNYKPVKPIPKLVYAKCKNKKRR